MGDDTKFTVTLIGLIAIVGFLWRVAVFIVRLRDQYLALDRKVGIMWGFQGRRGQTEAENDGVYTAEPSDHRGSYLPDRVRERFADLKDELHAFYREHGRGMSDDELKLEIEGRFGPRLVTDVCKPLRWHEGACLHVAAIIAREADQC